MWGELPLPWQTFIQIRSFWLIRKINTCKFEKLPNIILVDKNVAEEEEATIIISQLCHTVNILRIQWLSIHRWSSKTHWRKRWTHQHWYFHIWPNVISAVDSSVVFPSILSLTYFLYFRRSLLHKYEQHIIFFDQRSTIWNEKEKDSKLLRHTGWQFFHKNNKSQPFTLQSRCGGLHVPHP